MTAPDETGPAAGELIPAAEYLRKSTDRQEYSTALQAAANRAYAASRGMRIVRTYADEGKSGVGIGGRDALKRLLDDVQSGCADFTALLVYDVSRWGRFQDIDESGYYEHICKRAGIAVHYCVEPFANDGSPFSVIVKNIKRAMAGEYSRELSAKVFAAHARFVPYGYSQGGAAGYGLGRRLLDENGEAKLELRRGERKNIQTDRVVWVPGDPEEIKIVRRIFESFVRDGQTEPEIARALNGGRIAAAQGGAWTPAAVRRVLRNERYIGNYVWNRVSTKLKAGCSYNAPDTWIRAEGVIEPIVPRSLFVAAREMMRSRTRKLTQEDRLEPLRRLLRKHGHLTGALIARSPGVPAVSSYARWFGGLIAAYRLIGYAGPHQRAYIETRALSNEGMLNALRELLQKHGFLNLKIIDQSDGVPDSETYRRRFGSLRRAYDLAGFAPARRQKQRNKKRPSRVTS